MLHVYRHACRHRRCRHSANDWLQLIFSNIHFHILGLDRLFFLTFFSWSRINSYLSHYKNEMYCIPSQNSPLTSPNPWANSFQPRLKLRRVPFVRFWKTWSWSESPVLTDAYKVIIIGPTCFTHQLPQNLHHGLDLQ